MALTRHATGHTARCKPAETTTSTVSITKKKTGAGRPKANTSKPRAKVDTASRVKGGRVEKRGRPAKAEKVEVVGEGEKAELVKQKRKPTVKDKVEGALEKVVGAVERRPGKKGAGTKKMRGTDGKGSTRAKKA